ncbi:MAG: TIGR04282 family arsenosugar biosynthesis glycosyltransferase [cyanobacterium endosymbiont of Rhopalodia musculus]|uniref:TIGR04282 family arsenosugar biosynthesis glycosyltransferase n=1 Tax=cyanobacterium endosymbiont of Epithemia clementina EcSB TaxID=3034674 RepID=UPI0024801ABC|nr:TIGR04282 family arsenosugar biosynthesis glycosyltransferase [cyanobacterium endosymbiont of Epithemia clementina EcSB]WGT67640.1 TIGR04282 family arsenosugar biosynthesis glycosyltransferase [cyanobacterium endosymbiont of Epithemia clementina EcSB]
MTNKNCHRLIVFTRYPEPKKTKTRLIPALGAEGAAKLQLQLTEHTIIEVKKLMKEISTAVYYTGGSQEVMKSWLGNDLNYCPQQEEDLGNRMKFAFEDSFKLRFSRVVIIGIDCPDLNIEIIGNAFELLDKNDLVLGEASDGGYYLIGLQKIIPELFQNIPWGTNEVLSKTIIIAQQLKLNTFILPVLSDIDRPEDLAIWEKYRMN